jgi:2-oxoglutarate ferredoxin oxidoreductase subunit beta
MVDMNDYAGGKPAWCPGCGDFGILNAVKKALVGLPIEPNRVLMVSGIGQAGKLPHYTRGNVFNSLHGRTLPVATGAKLANPELTVIAIGGDGDGYGEGGNHFVHAMRRNIDITYLVHNNQVYALTKGQASPTSDPGFLTPTTPNGADQPYNPIAVALAVDASFVARGFAGDVEHLSQLIMQGIRHHGFALIDVLQPCVTYNHKNTFAWYREKVYKLEETGYDSGNKMAAFEKAQEWDEGIPIGVIYRKERATYEERFPALKLGPLARRKLDPLRVERVMQEFV